MDGLNRYIIRIVICVALAGTGLPAFGVEFQSDSQTELEYYLDSLVQVFKGMPDGMDRLKVLDEISLNHYNVDSTYMYSMMELELAEKLNDGYYLANTKVYFGWYYYQNDEFEKSADNYYDALHYYDSSSSLYDMAICYYGLGMAKGDLGDDIKADEYYMKALELYEKFDKQLMVSEIYRKLALARSDYHLYQVAEEYIQKAFAIDEELGDSASLSDDYTTLGVIKYRQYLDLNIPYFLFSAKDEMLKGYELALESGELFSIYWVSGELMRVFQEIAKMQDGIERTISMDSSRFFRNVNDEMIDKCAVTNQQIDLELWQANDLSLRGEYEQALKILNDIESRSKMPLKSKKYLYKAMIYVYESLNNDEKALEYTKLMYHVDMENYNRDFAVRVTSVENERELSQMKLRQQKQLYTIVIVSLCFVMVLILAIVILHGFLRNRKLNARLASQNDEIVKKNEELNERNAEIMSQRDKIEVQRDNIEITTQMLMDSINYAKHIQDAVVTSRDVMHRIFGDTLIYWNPMNVVSGDFYWAMQRDNLKILAVADCTGHGVPGAFMSMFAISSLNSIVSPLSFTNIKASDVLDMLRAKIISELHQSAARGDSIESVDMAFCIIDTNKMQMQYAGANRPLLIARDGNIDVYKPDKMPVGLHVLRKGPFTNNVIDLRKGDTLYMYTDGITDQFGYEDANAPAAKFSTKRLGSLLRSVADKSFAEQYEILDKTITDWRTASDNVMVEQYDDQLLMGVRIS